MLIVLTGLAGLLVWTSFALGMFMSSLALALLAAAAGLYAIAQLVRRPGAVGVNIALYLVFVPIAVVALAGRTRTGAHKPGIIGIERYEYEPSGDAYNVAFELLSSRFGTQEIVIYNPRDEQEATSHAMDILQEPRTG